jgi:hypothetical protein
MPVSNLVSIMQKDSPKIFARDYGVNHFHKLNRTDEEKNIDKEK